MPQQSSKLNLDDKTEPPQPKPLNKP